MIGKRWRISAIWNCTAQGPVLKSLTDVLAALPLRHRRSWFLQIATWCNSAFIRYFSMGQTLTCVSLVTCTTGVGIFTSMTQLLSIPVTFLPRQGYDMHSLPVSFKRAAIRSNPSSWTTILWKTKQKQEAIHNKNINRSERTEPKGSC
jgi:hypothetical protein